MAGELTLTQLNGLVKKVYGKAPIDLLPDENYILKTLKFESAAKLGDTFEQMVLLARSGGFTWGGNSASAYTLNTAVPMISKSASVKGYEYTHRARVAYGVLSRARQGGPQAFTSALTLVFEELMRTFGYFLELTYLWGGRGSAIAASSANQSATSTKITIKASEWAPAIWSGAEGRNIALYTNNTGSAIGGTNGYFTISAVDIANTAITVTGVAGDISALDTAISGNANNVWIYPQGAFGNEPASLYQILANTGTLFGIDSTAYNLFQGNTYSAGSAALTFGKLESAVAQIFARSGYRGDATVYLNPFTFANISADQAAMRLFDGRNDNGSFVNGVNKLKFWTVSGPLEVVPHPYMKAGYAMVMADPADTSIWRRVGSTEITNTLPGSDGNIFVQNTDQNSWETRVYADQAPFCSQPAVNGLINNIVNS